MTISYRWLCDYLPVKPLPELLSKILTSIGLEIEGIENYESIRGGLKGLCVGLVVSCERHPAADKLEVTQVDLGGNQLSQIVCGAPNVAQGQKVVVAMPGTTIYPIKGEPMTLKSVRIRGQESHGMLCAADEIGQSDDHAGILILPPEAVIGSPASDYLPAYNDVLFQIGLTPNHMDAMSHYGVARDICVYLSHQDQKEYKPLFPTINNKFENQQLPLRVTIENREGCRRYSGVSIEGIQVGPSPVWMQQKLLAVGLRPINNIVDVTNFVLQELGQPLHAYDADYLAGHRVIAKNLPAGTTFITLDNKQRRLSDQDLMICREQEPICMAGVFGGLYSGVQAQTRNIFLEAAWFSPSTVRKTSLRHELRTEAASHFEKGVDISQTLTALKRAAALIVECCGGSIASAIVDEYPDPQPKKKVSLQYAYLKKLSGVVYPADQVKKILLSLGFELLDEDPEQILVAAPYHKPDIQLPADLVEEILRIDGLDRVNIPAAMTFTPSPPEDQLADQLKEKIAGQLASVGFYEILTNSITNAAYVEGVQVETPVKMINSLNASLNILRPSLLETGLESIAYNINRKNKNLRFFEFGKTYSAKAIGDYREKNHLALYATGNLSEPGWKENGRAADFYYLKGIVAQILSSLGISSVCYQGGDMSKTSGSLQGIINDHAAVHLGIVHPDTLTTFDIRQPVFFADLDWDFLVLQASQVANSFQYYELAKQLPVERDLAITVPKGLPYSSVEKTVKSLNIDKLQRVQLFDIFESEKIGEGKKSLAITCEFVDQEKTLTEEQIDAMMQQVREALEEELQAEVRK